MLSIKQQQLATEQIASIDPKAELTRALRNPSGHNIQARHLLIVIAEQQLKGFEDRALHALGQVFIAEDLAARLAQPAADASNAASDLRGPSRAVVGLAKIANHRRTSNMRVTATEAKNRFGSLCAQTKRGPVFVDKAGQVDTVILSVEQYMALQAKHDEADSATCKKAFETEYGEWIAAQNARVEAQHPRCRPASMVSLDGAVRRLRRSRFNCG
ncbi:hypothetical protein [Delftia sp. GW456-R20]|uniref:hypothetical protein n=1 Tax=Delftia sp. GW456-R20 TaxID=1827145 RepID=UPI001E4EAFF0|nr:hypothetical protein [Delftia sp. GW456-R20]